MAYVACDPASLAPGVRAAVADLDPNLAIYNVLTMKEVIARQTWFYTVFGTFFMAFGTAALFRWLEVGRSRWLFVAGLAGGASLLIKIVGLYYVAGGLLFIAYYEACCTGSALEVASTTRDRGYRALVTAGALLLVTLVVRLVVRATT